MKGRFHLSFSGKFKAIFLLHLMLACIIALVATCRPSSPGSILPDSVIEVWYGNEQSFGMKGNPQRWINISGTVRLPGSVRSTYYTLNGNARHPFSLGRNMTRLAGEGDFNIEIDRHSLKEGNNKLMIAVEDTNNIVVRKKVKIRYSSGRKWPLPYYVDWKKVRNISQAVQVVDG